MYVKKGDVLFIEAGTIHAIGKDILIAEIQQNSNVTYRVYDYGRERRTGRILSAFLCWTAKERYAAAVRRWTTKRATAFSWAREVVPMRYAVSVKHLSRQSEKDDNNTESVFKSSCVRIISESLSILMAETA